MKQNVSTVLAVDSPSVVITGASTGIGAACARYLDEKGFRVFASVRKQADADRIAALGRPRLTPLFLEVTDAESIAHAAQSVDAALHGGGLSGLVNNAATTVGEAPMEFVDIGALRHMIEVNAIAPVVVTQAFLPMLRRAHGRVVNISSIQGLVAVPIAGPYCMAKFALEAFTDCLRQELADWGMHVIAVEPGSIDTPMWTKGAGLKNPADWSAKASRQQLDLYGKTFQAYRRFNDKTAANAISPDAVSEVIFKALTAKRPRPRYLVGTDARVFALLAQICPTRVVDWVGRKVVGFD